MSYSWWDMFMFDAIGLKDLEKYKTEPSLDPAVYRAKYSLSDIEKTISYERHRLLTGNAMSLLRRMAKYGATDEEMLRALEYFLVCVDAMKHHLDCAMCAVVNDISGLRRKYARRSSEAKEER